MSRFNSENSVDTKLRTALSALSAADARLAVAMKAAKEAAEVVEATQRTLREARDARKTAAQVLEPALAFLKADEIVAYADIYALLDYTPAGMRVVRLLRPVAASVLAERIDQAQVEAEPVGRDEPEQVEEPTPADSYAAVAGRCPMSRVVPVEGAALALWRHGRTRPVFFAEFAGGRLVEAPSLTGASVWPTVAEFRAWADGLTDAQAAVLAGYRLGTVRLVGRIDTDEPDARWADLAPAEGGAR